MSAATELLEFFEQIWKDTEGYVYLPVKGVNGIRKFMMPWPSKADAVVNHVLKWSADETAEVFFSPAIFRSRKPLQKEVLGSWVAWVDFDGNFPDPWPESIAPVPTMEVQSSLGSKRHVYWEFEDFIEGPKAVEDITRSLAHALDADLSGWDANQFLRPPHSVNRKPDYPKPIVAKVVRNRLDRVYDTEDFAHLPRPKDAIREAVEVGSLPDIEEVLAQAKWDDELLELFRTSGAEMQHQGRDRSGALQRLAYEGAEHGWKDEQIMAVLLDADDRWQKYTARAPQTRQKILVDLINRARAKVGYDAGGELSGLAKSLGAVQKVEDVDDDQVLFSVAELAAVRDITDWTVEGLLIPRGFGLFTGRPGVGKTQLACQLGADLASGRESFLDRELPGRPMKVLVLSLEMNKYQLPHIMVPLNQRYPDLDQRNMIVYAKGEKLPLDEESGQAYFEALLEKFKPEVVIIDSMSHMSGADLTSDKEMKEMLEYLQVSRNKHGYGLIVIHHHRKKANDAQSKKRPNDLSDIYGSFYITAAIDFALDLEERPEDQEEGTITLSMLKARYSRVPEPVKVTRSDTLHFDIADTSKMFQHLTEGDDSDQPGKPGLGL